MQAETTAHLRRRFGPGCASVVVGNPPWGSPKKDDTDAQAAMPTITAWCNPDNGRPIGDSELSQAFIHLTTALLTEGGRAGLLVSSGVRRAEALPAAESRASDYVLGIDAGQNAAMSAAAAYFRDFTLEAVACFPELPSLAERGLADGVGDLYQRMAERGELFQAGRRVSDIPALLRECLERWGRPVAIACDRWRLAELKQHLEAVSFPLAELVERGQGF